MSSACEYEIEYSLWIPWPKASARSSQIFASRGSIIIDDESVSDFKVKVKRAGTSNDLRNK